MKLNLRISKTVTPMALVVMGAFGVPGAVCAGESGGIMTLEQALHHASQGAWVVARGELEALLQNGQLPAGDRKTAAFLLAKAFLETDAAGRVLEILDPWKDYSEACQWMAKAMLRIGENERAERLFEKAAQGGANALDVAIGRAEALAQRGEHAEALEALQPWGRIGNVSTSVRFSIAGLLMDLGRVDEAKQEQSRISPANGLEESAAILLEGRIALAEGDFARAESRFSALLVPGVEVAASVYLSAALARADTLQAQGNLKEALLGLGTVLRGERDFFREDVLYRKYLSLLKVLPEGSEEELLSWTRFGAEERRGSARFYLAQRYLELGKTERALEEWKRFSKEHPNHPWIGRAALRGADLSMAAGDWGTAFGVIQDGLKRSLTPSVARGLRMLLAGVFFGQGKYAEALLSYEELARDVSEEPTLPIYNGALCALRLKDVSRANSFVEGLRKREGASVLVADLECEIALQRLREGGLDGELFVQAFVETYPKHLRVGELRVALAEWYFEQSQTAVESTQKGLFREKAERTFQRVVADFPETARSADAEYLAVFLAGDSEGDAVSMARLLELGESFLQNHPRSPLGLEVRMKLGEAHMRRKDFANAETQFAEVEKSSPEGGLAETALYLAGNCASELLNPGSLDRALEYWNRVAQKNGPLKWDARYQQAVVKSRIGEEAQGVVLFDLILDAQTGVSRELKWSARCGKADALYALARRSEGAMEAALQEYRVLAESEGVSVHWRNQALYKMAKAVESKDRLEALRGFYRVLDAENLAQSGEFFWLFKAGFDAARILESEKRWADCVALYERLGKLGAPRSHEARLRARQLRLENFLWE